MRAKIFLCYTRYKLAKALDYLRYICDFCERTVAYTYRVFILGLCTILTRNGICIFTDKKEKTRRKKGGYRKWGGKSG